MRSRCRCRSVLNLTRGRARRGVRVALVAVLTALPVVGTVAAAAAGGNDAVRITTRGVDRGGHDRPGQHFSAQRLRDVRVVVQWGTLVGSHTQRLVLQAPDGSVYQTFRTAVESVTGQATVETVVPVAGSWITDYSLYGKWRVSVYLDENARAEASKTFVLTP